MAKASKGKNKLPKSPKGVFSGGKRKSDKAKANPDKDEQSKPNVGKSKPNFPQQLNATKHSHAKHAARKPDSK